ncbi:hypothetical protein GCE9029_02848 [Grimontia celer]|uniref:NadR/Ttd14 AAA domain-containing protein n=1 Tax=Grimontia celer TaxID=1796497 RepID=A0A128F5S2_9GAMM|nr:AAA family ATPase [Grimontia celer]CZF81820.1 hypothetical protein GCE9029_02848 [Grimontia celer]
MNNFIVFTGGPGSGKTTVIEALRRQGYCCAPETGRKVIQEQVKQNGTAFPWLDKIAFRDEMVRMELANFNDYRDKPETVFFDRSILDCLGYSLLEALPTPKKLEELCEELTYRKRVFVFPPWQEIFENDAERKQDFEEAVRTYEVMVGVYERSGYRLIEVPRLTVEERIGFILGHIQIR